jgi:UDP-N-acetylglucosamine 4,6-dehydratase
MFTNKIILITGGTGSFGEAFLKYILKKKVKEVRIFSRDEKKQEDLRIKYSNAKIKFIIGDVRDFNSLDFALKEVDYVFHAAALKQVPSCEFFPIESIKTNILGSENLANACIKNKVKKVIGLSTDKAVYPINAMGASKALMEKIFIAKSRIKKSTTCFCITRYGNVMTSRGSVIPLFISQIKENKPLTITDPNMTRFLMSLEDSISLVIKAFKDGQNGDIFIKKAPSATIDNLAKALMKIYKKKMPIKIIGTRHGEKKYETLLTQEEFARTRNNKNFFIIKMDNRDLNYNSFFIKGDKKVSKTLDYNSSNAKLLSEKELIVMLKRNIKAQV